MQGVSVRQTVALVDESSGKVEEVSSLQHHFKDGAPDVGVFKVC